MTRRLPRIATATAQATLPPTGLDGLDPAFSRLVDAPESGTDQDRGWHVLDNGPVLDARGIRPVGTVLCVHGNPTWSYLWRRLVAGSTDAAIAGNDAWRVIAVDQLEMGFSERTGVRRTLARRVRDLGDLTRVLELAGPVITLGHDWGGAVSLGWAVDHPNMLSGVMLLNTAVHQSEGVPIPAPLRLALSALGPATVVTPAFLETTLALAHPPLSASVKAAFRAPYRSAARRGGVGGFVADIPLDSSHDSRRELDRIADGVSRLDVPALMLWGPRDPIFSDRYLDDLITRMPHADVHRFEGAGHLVGEDRDYVTPVLDWLGDRLADPRWLSRTTRSAARIETDGVVGFDTAAPSSRPTQPADGVEADTRWSARTTPADGEDVGDTRWLSRTTRSAARIETDRVVGFDTAAPSSRPTQPAHGVEADTRWSARTTPADGEDSGETRWLSRTGRSEALGRRRRGAPGDAQRRSGEVVGSETDRRPLWHHIDELRGSDDIALIELRAGGRTDVSWRLLSRRVHELATGFDRLGMRHGDRVSLLIPPGADLTAVLYACLRIGAVAVVADAGLGLRGLTRAVRGARPAWLIGELPGLAAGRALGWPGRRISTARYPTSAMRVLGVELSLGDVVAFGSRHPLPNAPAPADTAAVLFTSGSTGPAKGVVYTHAQLEALCSALADQYGIRPGTGLVAGFAPFALLGPAIGARSVTPDMDVTAPRTLTAKAVADAVAAASGEVVFLSPAAIGNVVATADALDAVDRTALAGVRVFLSAGAPVASALLEAASELMPGATAHTPYGMTEGLLMTDTTLDDIRKATTGAVGGVLVGAPVAGVRVRVSALDRRGLAVGDPSREAGVTGEILVAAAHIEDHYDKLWITDRASRRGSPPGDRWHRTGDVGHLDDDGRLWIEGRLPHVISTAAGPVTPVGPEQRIGSLDRVVRAAVVGVGPLGTQQIVAVVEPARAMRRPGLADAELTASVRRIAEVPLAAVIAVPALPTDIRHNSKIDRARVAGWAAGVLAGGRMTRLSTKRP